MVGSKSILHLAGALVLFLLVPAAMADGGSSQSVIQENAGNAGTGSVEIDLNQAPLDTLGYYEISGMTASQQSAYFSKLDKIINPHPPTNASPGLQVLTSMSPILIDLDQYQDDLHDVAAWAAFRRKVFLACKSPSLAGLNHHACELLHQAISDVRATESAAPPTEASDVTGKGSDAVVMPLQKPAQLQAATAGQQ